MRTKRKISNISYNTIEYFEKVINKLYSQHVIEWCYWIYHKADSDDNKNHIHFVLEPTSTIDTFSLREQFIEVDPNNIKPLCVTAKWFYTNSLEDWILYCAHYKPYLLSKGLERNYYYSFDDFKATDIDAFKYDLSSCDLTKYNRMKLLQDAVNNKIPFAILVQNGQIPINLRSQYEFQYNALRQLDYADKVEKGFIPLYNENITFEEIAP